MSQAPGFAEPGKEDYVCRLRRYIYGLKQAGREWYNTLKEYLEELGFTRSIHDHALFIRRDGDDQLIVGLHVDDPIIISSSLEKIHTFEAQLNERFPYNPKGEISYY
jgi:hypothetical protein